MNPSDVAPLIGMVTLFVTTGAVLILRGPLGRALAERIAGRHALPDAESQRLRQDVDELRAELGAMQERLDFAERLLARAEHAPPPGRGA
jgi:hypothetical protein